MPSKGLNSVLANTNSAVVDKEGNRDLLRWPRFRGEMLTQTYWNAGEDKGRVKVTITEGYLHGPGIFPFTRTKNLVSFSFQHAPQRNYGIDHMIMTLLTIVTDILENTGIAWPNSGMWYQSSRPAYHIASPAKRGGPSEDMDLHAHSPRKRMDSIASMEETMGHSIPIQTSTLGSMHPPATMQPPVLSEFRYNNHAPDWASAIPMQDPFVESSRYMNRRYGNRSNESDQPMPDYSRSITPASLHNAPHDMQTQPRSTTALHNEAIFNDAESIFNAQNNPLSGVVAPANTRVSSAANTPPIQFRPSAAAEARVASYTSTHERSRAVSITTKDAPPKPRETSDISMKSQFSEDQPVTKPTAEAKPHPKLATEVKGRKEGKGSEQLETYPLIQKRASKSSIKTSGNGKENTTATVTTTVVLSDGKRKRTSTASGIQLSAKDEEALGSSPTGRVSKKMGSPAAETESPEILAVARALLGEGANAM